MDCVHMERQESPKSCLVFSANIDSRLSIHWQDGTHIMGDCNVHRVHDIHACYIHTNVII